VGRRMNSTAIAAAIRAYISRPRLPRLQQAGRRPGSVWRCGQRCG
jgi:hypothetical protein